MTVKQLMNILSYHENDDEVTINNNHIKVVGKYSTGITYEEFINSAGGTWEGGCGIDPEGKFCGECATFDCDNCDWREGISMQCIRCGKEMENTTGGNYHCPSCNMAVNDLVYRPSEWKPFPQDFGKQEGWICPVCGRGLAPWMNWCPCQSDGKITYGTATGIDNDELSRLFELNDKRVDEMISFQEKYGG